MRVLLVADIVGGVRTFVAELAPALARAGVELHLALLGTRRHARELAGLEALVASLEVRDLRLEWMEDPWADVERTADWVQELVGAHRPDVLHLNTFTPVRAPAVPVLLSVHSCVLTWWRAVRGQDAPPEWEAYRELARTALARAELVVTPTRALLDALRAVHSGLDRARVIPNGRHVEAVEAERDPRLVVCAGRLWDQGKNAALLVAAADAIDGEVTLIGPGDPGGSRVRSLGALTGTEVLGWLARAAVFAAPARYEPFGLTALEAALSGCALVLGEIPSLREVWGEAALFVCPEDAAGLAAVTNRLLHDPVERSRMAGAARERAARYTVEAMSAGYLSAYRQLAATPAGVAL